jgi:hypothetical protein
MICQRLVGRPIADIGFWRPAGSAPGLFYPNSMRHVDGPVVLNRAAPAGQIPAQLLLVQFGRAKQNS